jgi:deoxyribonuclease V
LSDGRFGVVDVHYPANGGARAALVVASDTTFSRFVVERVVCLDDVAPYRPGHFYERELPALSAVLAGQALELLIVDGYVDLDPQGRPGLGAHAHAAFGVPVIGVAKTRFRSATHAIEIRRGRATRPLFITAAGIDRQQGAQVLVAMAGPYRVPDALRRVDSLARHGV